MADVCETVRVLPLGKSQVEFVVINADDFDEEVHELFDAQPKAKAKAKAHTK